jgi:hypothetical protein
MAQQFLTSINLNRNELQHALLHPLVAEPAVGPAGQVYYNTSQHTLYISDGTGWRSISGDITSIIAGDGLTGGGELGDITINVSVDDSTIEISSDALRVKAGGIGSNELAATTVTAGSYGSATAIATFTVDADGRLTAAGEASISTDLDIAGDTGTDTISLASETLTFAGGDGVTTSVAGSAVTIDVDTTVVRTSGDQTIGGNKTFSDNVVISGDLTVNGTTTTVNTETILLADNIITLNSNATGSATENAGIEVERGDDANAELRWNETTDKWQIEIDPDNDTYQNIATENYVATQISDNSYAISIGNGASTSIAVAHGLGTRDVIVQLFDNSTYDTVYADVVRTDTNTVTVTFAVAPSANAYRVLVQKIS